MLLPEVSGPLLGLQMMTRSFVPRVGGLIRNLRKTMLQNLIQHSRLIMFMTQKVRYLSVLLKKKKVNYVRQALKMVGLTEKFAPLVVMWPQ